MTTRWSAARPFVILGSAAIIAGGLLAAAVAQHPSQHLVWMSAYLVLVVGVMQIGFGTGQAWLSARTPRTAWLAAEWIIFNLGNAGVIVGTLLGSPAVVLAGTVIFIIGIAQFLALTRGGEQRSWLIVFRVLLGIVFLASLVGLVLSYVLPPR